MLHCIIWVSVIGAGLVTVAGFFALTFRYYDREIDAIVRRLK